MSLKRAFKIGASVLAFIVAFGAALTVVDRYAPWAKPADVAAVREAVSATDKHLVEIAGISIQTAINQKYDILIRYQTALAEAEKREDTNLIQSLRVQIKRLENEIRKLEAKQ